MPTVECERTECLQHGIEICIAKRVKWRDGKCSGYSISRDEKLLAPAFNPHCRKEGGKFKSNRVTGVLR